MEQLSPYPATTETELWSLGAQLLNPRATKTTVSAPWSLCAAAGEVTTMRNPPTATGCAPPLPQLEKQPKEQ